MLKMKTTIHIQISLIIKRKVFIFFIVMDDKWIQEFSEKEKDYNVLYKDNISYIRVYVL